MFGFTVFCHQPKHAFQPRACKGAVFDCISKYFGSQFKLFGKVDYFGNAMSPSLASAIIKSDGA